VCHGRGVALNAPEEVGAFQRTDDARSHFIGIDIWTNRAGTTAFFKEVDDSLAPVADSSLHARTKHRIAIVRVYRGV